MFLSSSVMWIVESVAWVLNSSLVTKSIEQITFAVSFTIISKSFSLPKINASAFYYLSNVINIIPQQYNSTLQQL